MTVHPFANDGVLSIALNDATDIANCSSLTGVQVALNAEGQAPGEIHLLPPDRHVVGVDGREWINDQPSAVIQRFNRPKPVDWEHATMFRAPMGKRAPAVGWIESLELRESGTWGIVEWLETGRNSVESKEYRFLSPVFRFESDTGRILSIESAALTNRPNLDLVALAHERRMEDCMDPELVRLLGLDPAKATQAHVNAAVTALNQQVETGKTALAAAQAQRVPDMTQFVPRTEYDAVCTRIAQHEAAAEEAVATQLKADTDVAINAALKAGKIIPANEAYFRGQCTTQKGLDDFKAMTKTTPPVASNTSLDNRETPGAGPRELNETDLAICRATGTTKEAYIKQLERKEAREAELALAHA